MKLGRDSHSTPRDRARASRWNEAVRNDVDKRIQTVNAAKFVKENNKSESGTCTPAAIGIV